MSTWDWDENEYGPDPEVRMFIKVRGVQRWMWIRNDIWMGRDDDAPPRKSWELFDRDEVILMMLSEAIATFPLEVRERAVRNGMLRPVAA